jgi:TfoX N-terminal domain
MAFDEQLAERIRKGLAGHQAVEKRMFGGLCFMVKGAMCCGVHKNDFVARVGSERRDEALGQAHARLMGITGRPMRGFLFVGPEGVRTDAHLRKWLNWCTSYAASDQVQKKSKRCTSSHGRAANKKTAKRKSSRS